MSRNRRILYLGSILALLILVFGWYGFSFQRASMPSESTFDGQRAFVDVQRQVGFGPRTPGSEAHEKTLVLIESELAAVGWRTQRQSATVMGHPVINLIASRTSDAPVILLGAHYDTRLFADRDPQVALRGRASPGADDGASGVAVLLELARTLPRQTVPITLVFFDAEDNGRIPGWEWILGSRAFVQSMVEPPQRMVLVDMVGDKELNIRMEANSSPELRASIWATAASLGHADVFLPEVGGAILDDHVPFLEAGIPAVDIIDIDYAHWHTTQDTPDKVSAESLQIVGDVLWTWVVEQTGADNGSP